MSNGCVFSGLLSISKIASMSASEAVVFLRLAFSWLSKSDGSGSSSADSNFCTSFFSASFSTCKLPNSIAFASVNRLWNRSETAARSPSQAQSSALPDAFLSPTP